MKALPIKIDGIQFRSKLEARWYLFMKRLGWNIIYEPDIEGLNNWIPDFLIIGFEKKILVDVKPIDTVEDWEKHPDRIRIENSGIKNLKDYELLILGTNLQLDGRNRMGLLYTRDAFWEEGRSEDGGIDGFLHPYTRSECVFSIGDDGEQIGFMDEMGSWHCRITGDGGKTYLGRGRSYNDDDKYYKKIDTSWNEAGTQLQWNTPTSEYYMKGKIHPNKGQYCYDCENNSIIFWKKKNWYLCEHCKQTGKYPCVKHYYIQNKWEEGIKRYTCEVNTHGYDDDKVYYANKEYTPEEYL